MHRENNPATVARDMTAQIYSKTGGKNLQVKNGSNTDLRACDKSYKKYHTAFSQLGTKITKFLFCTQLRVEIRHTYCISNKLEFLSL